VAVEHRVALRDVYAAAIRSFEVHALTEPLES
jgi:hypothetical protein